MSGYCRICLVRYADSHVCDPNRHRACIELMRLGLPHLICERCKEVRK
jgi:hypothetical protein